MRPQTKRVLISILVAPIVLGAGVLSVLTTPRMVLPNSLAPHTPDLANGETMFHAGGCAQCHATPGQDDFLRLGGGLALKSPFGTFYVPNISSDPKDGIGNWTDAQFATALSKGTSPDGRHYYPALPYTSYQRMTLGDLRDLHAYLKTLPAVAGRVRDHDLRFPYNVRAGIGLWKLLFLDGEPFKPNPNQPESWNRGAYLVNGPAHCGECHTPRNFLGAPIASQRFAGGPNPEGQGWIPNITPQVLGRWSADDFIKLLATGRTENGESVGGSMAQVVRDTARLPAADRAAMAAYIRSLPPIAGPEPPPMR